MCARAEGSIPRTPLVSQWSVWTRARPAPTLSVVCPAPWCVSETSILLPITPSWRIFAKSPVCKFSTVLQLSDLQIMNKISIRKMNVNSVCNIKKKVKENLTLINMYSDTLLTCTYIVYFLCPVPFKEWWRGINCYPCPSVRPRQHFGIKGKGRRSIMG